MWVASELILNKVCSGGMWVVNVSCFDDKGRGLELEMIGTVRNGKWKRGLGVV